MGEQKTDGSLSSSIPTMEVLYRGRRGSGGRGNVDGTGPVVEETGTTDVVGELTERSKEGIKRS